MEGASLGMAMAAVAAVGLVWWGLHASTIEVDYIDHEADEAFRARTRRKPLNT